MTKCELDAILKDHAKWLIDSRANAHLIVAAPEMYRELEIARAMLNGLFKTMGSLACRSEANKIDLLLAKARGE